MINTHILVVDDDNDIRTLLEYNLSKKGFKVGLAENGKIALKKMNPIPDLLIVDIMMPEMDGIEFCRTIRQNTRYNTIPLIFLTAKDREADEVAGLDVGADDYIAKPISMKLLIARVNTLLRRTQTQQEYIRKFDEMEIDSDSYSVLISKVSVELTRTEFDLIELLSRHPQKVFSRTELIDRIHGMDTIITERAIDVHIRNLRKKLGKYSAYIQSAWGRGYVFRDDALIQ